MLDHDLWSQRHEWIELRRGEHARFDDIEAAILRELPEIEHVVADRYPDARCETVLGGEYAVREILDREMGIGRDVDEGAEFGIVGMGHAWGSSFFLLPLWEKVAEIDRREIVPDEGFFPRRQTPHRLNRAARD